MRKIMQDEGVINPNLEVKRFTQEFVEKLSKMPLEEEITISNHSFYDSKGSLIATIPLIGENENK